MDYLQSSALKTSMSAVLLLVPQRFLMFKMLYLVALKKVIALILKSAIRILKSLIITESKKGPPT